MKRIVSFLIAILLCVCFSGIANARDDHEITMLNLLESMIQDMFYEAYYDEEKDVFVITYKNENIKILTLTLIRLWQSCAGLNCTRHTAIGWICLILISISLSGM